MEYFLLNFTKAKPMEKSLISYWFFDLHKKASCFNLLKELDFIKVVFTYAPKSRDFDSIVQRIKLNLGKLLKRYGFGNIFF